MAEHTRPVCPECQREPIKSRVYPDYAYPRPGIICDGEFRDERGQWHGHGGRLKRICCPQGHSWMVEVLDRCWCGWPDSGPYAKETE